MEPHPAACQFYNSTDEMDIKVTVPPLEEQYEIASVLNSSDKEIDLLQQSLNY